MLTDNVCNSASVAEPSSGSLRKVDSIPPVVRLGQREDVVVVTRIHQRISENEEARSKGSGGRFPGSLLAIATLQAAEQNGKDPCWKCKCTPPGPHIHKTFTCYHKSQSHWSLSWQLLHCSFSMSTRLFQTNHTSDQTRRLGPTCFISYWRTFAMWIGACSRLSELHPAVTKEDLPTLQSCWKQRSVNDAFARTLTSALEQGYDLLKISSSRMLAPSQAHKSPVLVLGTHLRICCSTM